MANFFDQFDGAEVAPSGLPRITITPERRSAFADAISSVESGGNYKAIGPDTGGGNRALGKYQVMASNVGPWSREVLGREVTPQEFLSNPQLQDQIFSAKFGSYVEKYGPEGAAKAWFAGEKGMNDPNRRDILGTSVADYGRKFMNALGPSQANAAPVSQAVAPAATRGATAGAMSNFFDQFDAPQDGPVVQQQSPQAAVAPAVSKTESFAAGAAQGATFNFYDELRGLMEAGGLNPKDPASLSSLFQGAYKYFTGDQAAAQRYDTASGREREAARVAAEANPMTSLAGNVAGAIAVPVGAAVSGATLPARMASGAAVGAGYGAAYGLGEGVGVEDRASRALVGGLLGGAVGGAAPAVIEGVTKGVGALTSRPVNIARAAVNPTGAAERAIGRAYREAVESDPLGMQRLTAAELAKQRGGPAVVMDTLGGEGRNLARSAGNISGTARDTLNRALDDRFESQGSRFILWLNKNFNYPNAFAQQQAIDKVEKTVNKGMYFRAYKAGDRPIWSPELERLVGSDAVVAGMKEAVTKGKDRSIAQGFGGFNPPFRVTPDGRLEFIRRTGGPPTYPDLQFWDYTYRAVRDKASEAFRSGRNEEASRVGDIAKLLRNELDNLVPEYRQARGVAATFFGAENALEAGQKFVMENFSIPQTRAALSKMTDAERKLFQDGFVSRFVETLERVPDRADIVKRIYNTPAARDKIQMVLGTQKALELEAMIRVETIMQMGLRAVQGNSTTVMQLLGAGLAGSAGGNELGFDPTISGVAAALMVAGKKGIDAKVAQKVAEMLVSKDPAILNRGLKMVASNAKLMNALRSIDMVGSKVGGSQVPSSFGGAALPALSRADTDNNQPSVPRPPGQ